MMTDMDQSEPYDWTDDPDLSGEEILDRFYQLPRMPIDQPPAAWLTVQAPSRTSGSRAYTIVEQTQLREAADWRELVA
jgi:hypothetical protein